MKFPSSIKPGGGVFIDKLKIKRIGFCLFGKVRLYWVAVPAGLGPPQGSGVWKKLPPAYFHLENEIDRGGGCQFSIGT